MRIESAGRTDRGLRRPANEDALLVRPALGLFAVADGMGGHAAGEVASALAIETLEARLREPAARAGAALGEAVAGAFDAANRAIVQAGEDDPAVRGLGTTLTALVLRPDEPGTGVVGHVGDSRAYRLRGGELEQLTTDHTWVQGQVELGLLTPEQARTHPFSSVLTRALGADAESGVDRVDVQLEPGDLLLLCTDGLTGVVDDERIRGVLAAAASLDERAQTLIDQANAAGGPDNITVVLVEVVEAG